MIAATVSTQWPPLLMVSGSSRNEQGQTRPNRPVFGRNVTSRGGGHVPVRSTVRSGVALSVTTVRVAVTVPNAVGANRTGTLAESPGAMRIGKDASGAMNCASEEMMLSTRRSQVPALFKTMSRSTKLPRQTSPKYPLSGIRTLSSPVPAMAVACRSTTGAVGSLLSIRMVAVSLAPMTVG